MALTPGDWEVTRSSGNIRYVGGDHATSPTYATVIEFHRWLQDLADDAVSVGDDEVDITDEDPSKRSTDNIITLLGDYNIGDTEMEHLYDGSIIQGATGVDKIIYDGIVNFGNSDVQIQIIQDGAVITDDWWNFGGAGLNADAAAGISHRFMIKTHDFVGDGGDIDGRRLIGTSRTFGNTYAEFSINGTSRGNNVLALTDADDLNNETIEGTVSGWTTIDNSTEGFAQLDVDNNGSTEDYYSEWNRAAHTINEFYERMKWLTRDGSGSTIYGLNGELFRGITHEIDIDTNTGTFSAFEAVTWTGGTGQMFAIDSTTAGTKMWMQLLTGVAPTDGQVITGVSTATAAVNTTVTDRSALVKTPFVGASTGSALIGSYGFGLETADLAATDKVFDLTNTQITPPNNVVYTVSGLVSGEDRVLVTPWDGASTTAEGDPDTDTGQMLLNTTLSTDNITEVVVKAGTEAAIPSDTPSTGQIRVIDDNGVHRRLYYSAWDDGTDTFTISGGDYGDGNEDFGTVNATATTSHVYIAYLDLLADAATEAYTAVYASDRDLVVLVRDGDTTPIKQYITSGSFTSSNSGVTAIRTTDE